MNVEIIEVRHYQNETEYFTLYTLRDSEGKFPLCITGSVYYGNKDIPIANYMTEFKVPHYKGNHDLLVYEIDGCFAVYNENHSAVTDIVQSMSELIEIIKEQDLNIFDFKYEK